MAFQRGLSLLATLALVSGCVTTMPFTQSLRDGGWTPADLESAPFVTDGEFELHSAVEQIGVAPRTGARLVEAPDDTTLVVAVTVAAMELRLTFARALGRTGLYTLRAVDGQTLGGPIEIGGKAYTYFPCYMNLGWRCERPIQPGTRDDHGVTLLVRLPKGTRPPKGG